MRNHSKLFDITVLVHHETDRAWLVSDDGDKKVWIPKSLAECEKNGDSGTWVLTAPEWILKDKELI